MNVRLYVEPGVTYSWEDFLLRKPFYSIALDGIVAHKTERVAEFSKDKAVGPFANFDHHAGVDRLATRSTSQQVYMEINLGLFRTFQYDGIPTANLFVNDCDEDTCLATWLLMNHERVIDHAEPAINRLVNIEDLLDSTAGAYPLGDVKIRRQMAWIFEPYHEARFNGRLKELNTGEMKTLIESVHSRIQAYTLGEGEWLGLEGQYEILLGGGAGWSLVRERGPAARLAMYADGIEAYVSCLGKQANAKFTYSVGRRSVWINFPMKRIFDALNKDDPEVNPTNYWGPLEINATIGGSPRKTGSGLSPAEVSDIINRLLVE